MSTEKMEGDNIHLPPLLNFWELTVHHCLEEDRTPSHHERSNRCSQEHIHYGANCDRFLTVAEVDVSLSLEGRIPDRHGKIDSGIHASTY